MTVGNHPSLTKINNLIIKLRHVYILQQQDKKLFQNLNQINLSHCCENISKLWFSCEFGFFIFY